jgi:serine/threonine protein kinase
VDPQSSRAEHPSGPDDDKTFVQPRAVGVPQPGTVLSRRFVLEQMLGAGGMSKVFLAKDLELEGSSPYVAIKVLGDAFKDHPNALTSLRREVANSRKLNHPNIVGVYDFHRDGALAFMVMEYMRGETLEDYLKRHADGMPWQQAWPIIRGCGEALAYMHEHHVIHSDFKPGNVFITEADEVKVLDLGIARTIDETLAVQGKTRFDSQALFALTPQYASCEMFDGQPPDRRDDIYALGCVSYKLLTGRHPFDGVPAVDARQRGLVPERPPGLRTSQWQALLKTLEHARSLRTANADEFLAQFGPRVARQNATPWILAVAALLLLGAGIAGWRMFNESPDQRFLDELVYQYRDSANPEVSLQQIALWLEQGSLNTTLGIQAFENGDYERGRYFLQDSASSARWVYDLVLKAAPDERTKRDAAVGVLTLANAYEIPATRLSDAGRAREALEYACSGVLINAYNTALKAMVRSLSRAVPDAASIQSCRNLPRGMVR